MDKKTHKKGQVLLLMVLLVSVALTMVFAASYQSVADTRLSKLKQESAKAIAAGQAAVEVGYTLTPGTYSFQSRSDLQSLQDINMTKSNLTITNDQTTPTFVSPLVLSGQQYTFYLANYRDGTFGDQRSLNKLGVYYGTASGGTPQCSQTALEMSYVGPTLNTDLQIDAAMRYVDVTDNFRTILFRGPRMWRYDCPQNYSGCHAEVTRSLQEWINQIPNQTAWGGVTPDYNRGITAAASYVVAGTPDHLQTTIFQGTRLWSWWCDIDVANHNYTNCMARATKTLNDWLYSASFDISAWGTDLPRTDIPLDSFTSYHDPQGNNLYFVLTQGPKRWRYSCTSALTNCRAVNDPTSLTNWLYTYVKNQSSWSTKPSLNTALDDFMVFNKPLDGTLWGVLFQGEKMWSFSCTQDLASNSYINCAAYSDYSLSIALNFDKNAWVANQLDTAVRFKADAGNMVGGTDNIVEQGPWTINGTTFNCRSLLVNSPYRYVPADARLLIVRVLSTVDGYSTNLGFSTENTGSNLPVQGKTIKADTWTRGGVHQVVQAFQSYPQIPADFFVTSF